MKDFYLALLSPIVHNSFHIIEHNFLFILQKITLMYTHTPHYRPTPHEYRLVLPQYNTGNWNSATE